MRVHLHTATERLYEIDNALWDLDEVLYEWFDFDDNIYGSWELTVSNIEIICEHLRDRIDRLKLVELIPIRENLWKKRHKGIKINFLKDAA